MNRNWAGEIQVTLLFVCFLKVIFPGRNNRDAFWENEGKIHKVVYVRNVFFM